jgi:hypothetical protein
MKCYIEVITKDGEESAALIDQLREPLKKFLTA